MRCVSRLLPSLSMCQLGAKPSKPTCMQLMPRAGVPCHRPEGHKGQHQTKESIQRASRKTQAQPGFREANTTAIRQYRRSAPGRAAAKIAGERGHAYSIKRTFGVAIEEYWATYALQGGHCAICHIATGKTKRLAVDHDHSCKAGHTKEKGCKQCVRGLLCSRCNRFLGQVHDDISAFQRAIEYLSYPPFQEMLRSMN